MIETAAALVALFLGIQQAHTNAPEWPTGRAWSFTVRSSKVPDNVLEANRPACCDYARTADGKILHVGDLVWLLKR